MNPNERVSLFSQLGASARSIWAKSGEKQGHGLLNHLLDVAAVAEAILEHEPASTRRWAARAFGLEESHCVRWIAMLAGLHDFGKAIPGFQAKWSEGMQADLAAGLQFPASSLSTDNHSLATNALLGAALQKVVDAKVMWLRHTIQAISAHHGYHFLADEINNGRPLHEPAPWAQARQEILTVYWSLMSPKGTPSLDELALPAVNWLAGLTSAADWIASNPEWFPLGERCDDIASYFQQAGTLAEQALRIIGWERVSHLLRSDEDTNVLMSQIVGRRNIKARPLQLAGDALLTNAHGPALLLVEAPMGEGKTELAFLAHLRLQRANDHRGLYVALPTQATGNALFTRALTFLGNFTLGHMDVQLVHGGSAMNEDVRHLRGIDNSTTESLSASTWFSQRRRPLLSPYGVGTVDQALFSTLNVKHHFVRLWGLANRVVVLDEVHAYDTYTSGLIVALLRWLKALGCSVVLMSATLPKARRSELVRAWGVADHALPELAYPRLILADDQGIRGEHFSARALSPIRLNGLGESLEELADKAVDLLSFGGCGALILNTVDRAQKLYVQLRNRLEQDVKIILFHARFPADERAALEQTVLSCFGVDGDRPERAVLVATQVAEQSLDIDFDFMLSDLAPIDLLLQRAGRLHRHVRERPLMHSDACFWVAGLQPERLPDLKETAWSYVYDAYILGRTWALLCRESILQLPGDIDRLVQDVYRIDEPLPSEMESSAREFIEISSYGEYLARVQKERRESYSIAIDPDKEPHVAYAGKPRGSEEGEGVGLENKTRLGQESITLVPIRVVDGLWYVKLGGDGFQTDQQLNDSIARQLYRRQLKVSRAAVVKHFKSKGIPPAFEHAILRNCYPLPLSEGAYVDGSVRIRLDAQLGLLYESGDELNEANV